MRIQHNIAAQNSYRQLGGNNGALAKNLEKLSSGYRINRAGDDAAGLAISEKMRAQITGLQKSQDNANDGISLVQTAEGALTEVHSMLNRMTELATQSANGTYDDATDRGNIQKEVTSLLSEVDRIADSTNFNGIKLLDGSLDAKVSDAAVATKGSVNLSDGVTINAPVEGAGTQNVQSFTLDFGTGDNAALLGADDEVTITYNDSVDGTGANKTFTMKGITGDTKEEQLANIAEKINTAAFDDATVPVANDIKGKYEASVGDDGKILLTAKDEGAASIAFKSAAVNDKQVTMSVTTVSADIVAGEDASDTGSAAAVNTTGGVNDLVINSGTPGDSTDISADDKLTFNFKVNGKAQSVTLTATNKADSDLGANEFRLGASLSDTTDNIKAALDKASFADKTATGIDESQLKVTDYFDIAANKKADGTAGSGSIQVLNNGTNIGTNLADFSLTDVKIENAITKADGTIEHEAEAALGTAVAGAGGTINDTAAKAAVSTYVMKNSFAEGEAVTFSGRLADGKDFSVKLTASTKDVADLAANEFKIGADAEATLNNIKSALEKDTTAVTTTNLTTSAKAEVTADKLFGTDATDEIKVELNTAKDGLKFTSNTAGSVGAGKASGITSVVAAPKDAITASSVNADVAGKLQSASENVIGFDNEKVEEGTTFSIDGKTFEFVSKAGNVSKEGNLEVVVANLGKRGEDGNLAADAATSNDIANAVMKAMDDDHTVTAGADTTTGEYTTADAKKYNLSVDAGTGTLKVSSQETGTEAHPLDGISTSAGVREMSVINFQTTTEGVEENAHEVLNVKAGDTVDVNGKKYEFLAAGERTTDKGSIGVTLDGTETKPVDVSRKLADAINENDTKLNATVNEKDGSVQITSNFNKYAEAGKEYAAPEVELPDSTEGLVLQVGETSDDFQRVAVKISNMDSKTLDINGIDVGTQDGARASIDKIKTAINSVSSTRGDLGAVQNRLEHTIKNLGVTEENMTSAESRIRDTDMASEMMKYTKNNILIQASQAMLAQANQLPQGVLQLLG